MMKYIKKGLLLIALCVTMLSTLRCNNSYLYKKLFFTQIQIELSGKNNHLFFPVAQHDGRIHFVEPRRKEGMYQQAIVLNSDQSKNFDNFSPCNEVSYDFNFFNNIQQGHLTIKDDTSGTKNIMIYLPSITRWHIDYQAKYELTNNNLIMLEASYKSLNDFRLLVLLLMIYASIGFGSLFIIIGIIKATWPPPKKHSYLELSSNV